MNQIRILKDLSEDKNAISSVYLVQTIENEQLFVMKKIKLLDNPVHRAVFEKEIGALYRLRSSDNIVHILNHESGLNGPNGTEGCIYLEYIDGETLQKINGSIISLSDKYSIIKGLISGLKCAHENSIIHRDINPSNIMIFDGCEVKIIDFGICKIKGLSQIGTTFQYATNKYSAPEVHYHSENATERSDIYSLGAVIYYIFTNKEPPLPEKFENIIESAGGIDIQIKTVLKKMLAYDQEYRYESIIDLEIDLAKVFLKYINSGENYLVKVPSVKMSVLRNRGWVSNGKTDQQLFQEDLPANFCDSYLTAEKTSFNFSGINYSMHCEFSNNCFIVETFKATDIYTRDKNRKMGIPVNGKIVFCNSYSSPAINHNSIALFNRANDHLDMIRTQKNIDNEFDNSYGFWSDFIAAMIESAQVQAIKINYERYTFKNGNYYFELTEDSQFFDENISTDTVFVHETTRKGKKTQIKEVGTFLLFEDDEKKMSIKASSNHKSKFTLPSKGQICIDYRREIFQYRKQQRALDEFRRNETNNNRNLKGIFVGIDNPESFQTIQGIQLFSAALDAKQEEAVTKILDAQDIALVQGPPGTGKTNVIVEVIRQLLYQNSINPFMIKRILIVSQSHSAVDKILDDLDPYVIGEKIIRIGVEEKFSETVRSKFGLENKRKKWVHEIIENSERNYLEQLTRMSITKEDFTKFFNSFEQLQIFNISDEDRILHQENLAFFYSKHDLAYDNKLIMQLIIQNRWFIQLEETQVIDEYFIKSATIVAGTCSGFSSNMYISDMDFEYVIVDEAAKATFPEIMISLVKAKKVVLVGDHKQLPPMFDREAIYRSSKKIDINALKNGGFGKIFETLPDSCKTTLNTQYRMHPAIGNMISSIFYENTVQNGISAEERTLNLSCTNNKALIWVTTSKTYFNKRCETKQGNSYINQLEVQVILAYLKKLDNELEGKKYTIGVITPYKAQLALLRSRLNTIEIKNINIEINTVDAFQGSQKDVILYSTVRSNQKNGIGFLREHPRMNVSFSRAKCLLIIVGDMDFICNERSRENLFPQVANYIERNKEFCEIINY